MKHKRAYKKKKKRVGRGNGSGHGKTSCRGEKGQMSRAGSGTTPGFEGGQMTFIRRLPKRGFNNANFKKDIKIVNVDTLNKINEKEITPEILLSLNVIEQKGDGVKVLGKGKIDKACTVHAHYCSAKAKQKIEQAGGTVVIVSQ
ncbi:MAG: 50S ribosomal protein L15 [Candidatus Omnitrophica bacterium]|nr:50S ribosomal protein L15 [Candidatus Omnitrophota bacterium]